GFAWGRADFAGNPTCNGQLGCAGVFEHVHPAIAGSTNEVLTGDYWGIDFDPLTADVWFGGVIRTTRFKYHSDGDKYFQAELDTEEPDAWPNRIDVWPDAVGERD